MVYNSNIDDAMDEIKQAMDLLRRNTDSDSILFWEALLEINRAFATEDIEKARGYLTELLKVFILSSRSDFPDVYPHLINAYEHAMKLSRNSEGVKSIIETIERYNTISRV